MFSMRLTAVLFAATLVACSPAPTLSGDWAGDFDCSAEDAWAELAAEASLDDAGDGEFTGAFEASGDFVFEGDTYPIRIEGDVELELTNDEGGSQRVTVLWANCELWVADEYDNEPCSYGEDWRWDGEDELTWSDDECDLALERELE